MIVIEITVKLLKLAIFRDKVCYGMTVVIGHPEVTLGIKSSKQNKIGFSNMLKGKSEILRPKN